MPFSLQSTNETRPSIFKPIDAAGFKDEKLRWLGKATEWLFDFGQDGFEVVANPGKNNLIEKKATPAQGFKAVALKVLQIAAKILLIATVIVPVVALICRAVYLRKNDLCVRTLTLNDKSTYVGGTNADNQPAGKGKIIESDGNIRISGVFNPEGITDGTYSFESGKCNFSLGRRYKYSGGLDENGLPHGNGKMEYTGSANRDHYRIFSGGTFEGEFVHGDWAETGKYTKSDSMSGPGYLFEHTVFEGKFDDRNNPQYLIKGTITDMEGTVRATVGDAIFGKGNYQGQLKETYKDGTVIEGEFDWQNVQYPTFISGKVTFPCGAVYEKTLLDNGTYDESVTFPEVYEKDPTLAGQTYRSDAFKALNDDDGKKPSNEVLAPVLSQIFDGQLKVTYLSGDTYEGSFKDKKYHGQGVYTYADGSTYQGIFDKGELSGKVKIAYSNGAEYEGSYENGHYHGKGTYADANGIAYQGNFVAGSLEGEGEVTYPDPEGKTCQGTFVNGFLQGDGGEVYTSGKMCFGTFVDGCLKGPGNVQCPDGTTMLGTFVSSQLEGIVTVRNPNEHSEFIGEFKGGKPDGEGELKINGQVIHKGYFNAKGFQGRGIHYFEYGTYVGEFKDNMPHGTGELTDSTGQIHDARYENGVCMESLPR